MALKCITICCKVHTTVWVFQSINIYIVFTGIGKLKATVIEETVSLEAQRNDPPPTGQERKEDEPDSLDSSDRDGYHFHTPPDVSSQSEIQPCGIKLVKENIQQCQDDNDDEEEELSSDYKVIPDTSSTGLERLENQMTVESGTDDQASSGNFSQDDMSPRFAELPQQLSNLSSATETLADLPASTLAEDLKKTKKDRTMSMETRTQSMTSDASEQEIPPSSPRSTLTMSPTQEPFPTTMKFVYGETIEKSVADNMDIMTQSIYIGSEDCDSEMSSESHQSVVSQTTQRKVSSTEESNVTTVVKEEYVVSESVVKLSENVTENTLEETKSITKKSEVASKEETRVECEKSKETTIEKFVETRQEAKLSYSEVLKNDISKPVKSNEQKSVAQEAISELIKTDSVHQLVDSKEESSATLGKKLSYSEVLKSQNSKDDPIADWGKPLGLPSPNRPSTPAQKSAKKSEKAEEEPVDTNKVT